MRRILIVEDEFIEAKNLERMLLKAGYEVSGIARSVNTALSLIADMPPDFVLIDIFLKGDLTGIDLARKLRHQNIPFLYLSANSNKTTLDAAKATHPYGFLVKPFREKDVLVMLDVASYLHQSRQDQAANKNKITTHSQPAPAIELNNIIGKSKAIRDALQAMKIAGPSDISVLLTGESGTGKELAAQCIHNISPRNKKPFTVVNCATLPANLTESELFGHEKGAFTGAVEKRTGKFEEAYGGTIFLDEIGELPIDLQAKLLRVLQEREIEPIGGKKIKVDVRVIAATNRDLEEEVANGSFRMDLYYRLSVFPIRLPSLHERKEDIPLLAGHFIEHYSRKENKLVQGMSEDVEKALQEYSWPGNIRQLENVIARCVLLASGNYITSVQLPASLSRKAEKKQGYTKTIHENERDYIVRALEQCGWKLYGPGGAAELLVINASTLSSRMKKLGIEKRKGF